MDNFKRHHSLQIFALLTILCCLFPSCSPWESELDEIYEAAQNGDRLSQFAIIEERQSFKDIVPEETMQEYLWKFVEEGNPRSFSLGAKMDLDKIRSNGTQSYIEESEKIHIKWAYEGIKHNNCLSYKHLADHYMTRYEKNGNLRDSLKADELYQKSIEAGNMNLKMERDAKNGLKSIITGGIEYGKYSYHNVFNERKAISRLIFSCSYTYAYITIGATKLLFTAAWWKVILLLFGMLLLLFIPIALCGSVLLIVETTEEVNGSLVSFGLIFGFWNSMCFFAAVANHNLVWLNNTTSLLFPPSAYGIQQYLSIGMNWIALIFILGAIFITIKKGISDGRSIGSIVLETAIRCALFIVSYLMAQIGGYLMMVSLFFVAIIPFAIGAVASAPAMVQETVSGTDLLSESMKASEPYGGHFCKDCLDWQYGRCLLHNAQKDKYDWCGQWRC